MKKILSISATQAIAGFLLVSAVDCEAIAANQEYPTARRQSIIETIAGVKVSDPYRWMEEAESAELKSWVEAQTRIAEGFVAGRQYAASRARILALGTFDLSYAAKRRGDRLFYLMRPKGGGPVELHVMADGKSQMLLRSDQVPDAHLAETFIGGKSFGAAHWPDRAGNLVAYGYTDGIAPGVRLRILDSRTGRHLPDLVEELLASFAVAEWSATGDGFYYLRTRVADVSGTSGSRTEPVGLYYHRLGTDQDADVAIISQQPDDRHIYSPAISGDGRYLVVQKQLGLSPDTSYLVFDTGEPASRPLELFTMENARFTYVGNDGSRLYFQTTLQAPNGRIVAVDVNSADEIVEIIPETDLDMLAGSNVGGDVLGYFGGHFVLGYSRDGLPEIRIFDRKGSFERALELPQGSTIWGGLEGTPDSTLVTAGLLNALSPSRTVTIDVADGSVEDDIAAKVLFDSDDFVVKRVFFESRDGTRVPMSIVHHKDVKTDGSNPTLIYGYGMHKWVSFLFYQAHIVHWLELGGVYAMPAIRGGGEYGDRWHDAGIKLNRQNAIDDFVWAGKWLIENRYTSPSRLVANGSSASGPLAAIVPLRYADVFAAATVDYPVADLVRAPLYGNGALMVEEYGSIEDAEEGSALISQSPYNEAVHASECLMPTLVMVGERDQTVLPFHSYKYAAAMQQAQSCDKPVLLKMMRDTGHNYGLSPEAFAENTALQIAFLRKVLDF